MNSLFEMFRFTSVEKLVLIPTVFQCCDFALFTRLSRGLQAMNYGFLIAVLAKMSVNQIKS